ncbi:hypothetical protein ES703_70451 [subsurface metagenome]
MPRIEVPGNKCYLVMCCSMLAIVKEGRIKGDKIRTLRYTIRYWTEGMPIKVWFEIVRLDHFVEAGMRIKIDPHIEIRGNVAGLHRARYVKAGLDLDPVAAIKTA